MQEIITHPTSIVCIVLNMYSFTSVFETRTCKKLIQTNDEGYIKY